MKNYLSLVKFTHTIFALPFAMVGYFLGVNRPGFSFDWKILGLVVLCMVFARNAAMAFNRWQDRDIDGKNPRTAVREIPSGVLPEKSVYLDWTPNRSNRHVVAGGFFGGATAFVVDLRGGDVLVSQELLDFADVNARVEEEGGGGGS